MEIKKGEKVSEDDSIGKLIDINRNMENNSKNKLTDVNHKIKTYIHSLYPFVRVTIEPDPASGNYVIDAKWYYKNKTFRWRSGSSCGFLRSGHDDLELKYIMRELFEQIRLSAISMIGDELEKENKND